jgi:ADP-ribose pyrophosphatase YjhB (NUDIX family)
MEGILVTQKIIIKDTEGKILSLRRSKTDPTKPLSWDLPGGLVEEGEDLRASILREVQEEAGIQATNLEILDVFGHHTESGKYLICIGYVAQAISTDVTLSYEHDQYNWISKEEFLSRDSKGHIKKLIEKLN